MNQNYKEIIFHTKKLDLQGEDYRKSFYYIIKDDCTVDSYSVTNGVFRFEYKNKTGKWVKEHISEIVPF